MSAAPRGAPGENWVSRDQDGCRRQALRRPQPCATRPRSGGGGRPRPGRTTPPPHPRPVHPAWRGEVRVHGAPAGTSETFHGAPKSLSGSRSPPPDWRAFSRVFCLVKPSYYNLALPVPAPAGAGDRGPVEPLPPRIPGPSTRPGGGEVRVHGAPAGTSKTFHGAPKSLSGCRSPPPDWRAFSRVFCLKPSYYGSLAET